MQTPFLNSLVADGVLLNNYYVQQLCTPSRVSFMTGLYPMRVGLQHATINTWANATLPVSTPTLPEKLREKGYETHMVGKWQYETHTAIASSLLL